MEAAKFAGSTSTLLPFKRSSVHKRPSKMVVKASQNRRESRERDYRGRLVDENMITLRMRIRELKILETNNEEELPLDWMEWEKKYFMHYNEDVCEALGLLQHHFLNTRPCLTFGFVALVTLSVPVSTGVVLFYIMEFAKEMLALGIRHLM